MCVLSAAARGMGLWRKIMENLLQPAFEPADFVPERGSAAFFRDAAGRGSPAAISNLGVLYARGEGGVEKDGQEALKCFREAAEKKYPAGVLNLGIYLLTGPLELRDEHEAEKILTGEAEKGSPAAQCALGLLYSGRLYPAAADQESSLEWLRKSSAQGFPEADYLLALASLEGRGVKEDKSTAFALMGRAASSGVVAAQYRIGCFFRDGTGTAADFRNAAKWLELREMLPYDRHGRRMACRPHELLEVHREHLEMPFLGRDDDVLDISVDGNQRPRLDVMVASVRDKILDQLPGFRTPLHLIKHDEAFSLVQNPSVGNHQQIEESVEVVGAVYNRINDALLGSVEVDENIRFVFALRELFYDGTLADTTRPFDQERR